NFETRELEESVRVMAGCNADEWLATALEYEAEGKARAQAIDAYDRALWVDPERSDVLINCGTLCYEDGNLEKATEYFRRALALDAEMLWPILIWGVCWKKSANSKQHGSTSGKQFVWIRTIPTRTTIWLSFARSWA